jgi:hypothetical protein
MLIVCAKWLKRVIKIFVVIYLDSANIDFFKLKYHESKSLVFSWEIFLDNDDNDYNRKIYKYLNKKAECINVNLWLIFGTGSRKKNRTGIN